MKYILLLCLLITGPGVINTKAQQNALSAYTGKYQMTVRGQTGYIQITVKDGDLLLNALWNGEKNVLKHLSGDNFIMQRKDWSVKFIRGKKGDVVSVLVMGTDLWTKVNN
jgi:hypothetical protein